MLEFYFQQLGLLVSIVKQHIRDHLGDLFSLIKEFWNQAANVQITIISLVEALAVALDVEFKSYIPQLLGDILQIFDDDTSDRRQPSHRVLQVLPVFGLNLEEFLHLIIPALMKLCDRGDVPFGLKKAAIATLGSLTKKISLSEHASHIIHSMVRLLDQTASDIANGSTGKLQIYYTAAQRYEIQTAILDMFCLLIQDMGTEFCIFIPLINKVLVD